MNVEVIQFITSILLVDMNCEKVFLTAVLSVILTLQLCDTNAVKSKFDHWSGTKTTNEYHHQPRQPRSVSSVNETIAVEKGFNASMATTTEMPIPMPIKIIDQKYSQNTSGEYKHE